MKKDPYELALLRVSSCISKVLGLQDDKAMEDEKLLARYKTLIREIEHKVSHLSSGICFFEDRKKHDEYLLRKSASKTIN